MVHGMPHPLQPHRRPGQGCLTAAAVDHLLKIHLQSVNGRAGSLWAGFLRPEAEAGTRAAPVQPGAAHPEKVQEMEDKQKGLLSSRTACSLQGFNPAKVFSSFSLIFVVHPQVIPSSVAGRSSASLTSDLSWSDKVM